MCSIRREPDRKTQGKKEQVIELIVLLSDRFSSANFPARLISQNPFTCFSSSLPAPVPLLVSVPDPRGEGEACQRWFCCQAAWQHRLWLACLCRRYTDGDHIPIIPAELFEIAQKVRADRTNVEKDEKGNAHRKAKKYTAAGLEIVDEDGRCYIKKERIAPPASGL